MVLSKHPVQGRPKSLDYSRTRAYCACSRFGWGLFRHFNSRLFYCLPLWETTRYKLNYCLKGPLNQKQPSNQHTDCGLHTVISEGITICSENTILDLRLLFALFSPIPNSKY